MILTVDIGNTNITCGLFDGETLVKQFRLDSNKELDVNEYSRTFSYELGDIKPEGAVIGSVVEELNNKIQYSILATYGVKAHILSSDSVMPIKITVPNPKEVGADRLANAIRAYNIYHRAVIVVDLGTATTFDIVNGKGEFIGGLIAPGVETQLKSLNISTSKLPDIEPQPINTSIGNNTKDAILSGVIRGTASMVDGMIEKSIDELKEEPVIIATGGYSKLITKYTKTNFDKIYPYLTLEGLRDLFSENKPLQPIFE